MNVWAASYACVNVNKNNIYYVAPANKVYRSATIFKMNQSFSMIDNYLHQILAGVIRRKGIRTPNLWFWRPLFYHWNYSPRKKVVLGLWNLHLFVCI